MTPGKRPFARGQDVNAAVYSNVGRKECWAVFDAVGMVYDPMLQTCVFE